MNTFNQALTRMDRYIWYLAHRFAESIRGMEASDLHQEGLIKLYEVYSSSEYISKPIPELDAIFKTSLRHLFSDLYDSDKSQKKLIDDGVDLEEISSTWGHEGFNSTYLAHYQDHLNRLLSPDAATLLNILLHPTPAVYHLYNIQRMRRQAVQSQGGGMRVPTKLTQEVVGAALGFSIPKTKMLVRELRHTWRMECQRTNYKPNEATC